MTQAFEPAWLDIHDASFPGFAAANNLSLDDSKQPFGSSQRVRDIYLNDPELQKIYPLGLAPVGQRHFLHWLTTHGRKDQSLTDADIVQFLHDSAANESHGICLTYLLQPQWQEWFPLALTDAGWGEFRLWIDATYGQYLRRPLSAVVPPILSKEERSALARSSHQSALRNETLQLEGVNLLSHFCNPSGIQQAALLAKAALEKAGFHTSCRDIPVPRRIVPQHRPEWLGLEVFPVTILNQAATPYFVCGYERSGLHRRENVYRIAYWNWELQTVPDDWAKAAELVQEIWSPTDFVAQAMRVGMPRPVYCILPGVEIGPVESISRASLTIPDDHFIFLFMFDFHSQIHRKNPVGVFRAFQEAFRADDKVTLVIKTSGGDIHSADLEEIKQTIRGPNVIQLHELFSRARTYGLIEMADCFVSLHRSEGFGLGLAEAMLMGKPVVGTGYSGNLDFMTRENSLLVDYELVEITEDRPIYTRGNLWAEPSIEHAASLMREVFVNPEAARARARRAQPEIQQLLSLDAAGQRMRTRLQEITGR